MEDTLTKSQTIAADIAALLRARNSLLWVVTREEARAEQYLVEACRVAGYVPRFWDVAQGVTGIDGRTIPMDGKDPGEMLSTIEQHATTKQPAERGAWIMRDLAPWVASGTNPTQRYLRNLARLLPTSDRDRAQAIIVLTPDANVPAELRGHATVISWPLPDRDEIAGLLDAAIDALPDDLKANAAPNGTRDAAIDAACGLTGAEAQACFAKSIVLTKKVEPAKIAAEKKRVISAGGLLEWFDPIPGGLDAVGGLDLLKGYLFSRRNAYTPEARAYGLPTPKGALLVGPSGTGKSYTSKAIATAWNVPLLRLDPGALKSKFVGESESNLRRAGEIIKAVGRCVVWMDEIEKALAGATDGAADGGVSKDALGFLLNFMQEERGESFWIATSNDASQLPPELIGRFDTTWFVDLPTHQERAEIVRATLKAQNRPNLPSEDYNRVADVTDGFNGRELAAMVDNALYLAFDDGARQIEPRDLIEAARPVVPLSVTAADKIFKLREWSKGKARPATSRPTDVQQAPRRVQLDV
jgi:hypothetical protein